MAYLFAAKFIFIHLFRCNNKLNYQNLEKA